MIADYYFIRSQQLDVPVLYKQSGRYGFKNGYNISAIIALLLGILPNVPGFLLTVGLISPGTVPLFVSNLYHYAWFVGFFVSGIIYILLMRRSRYAIKRMDQSQMSLQ